MPATPATQLDYGRRIARVMAHVADRLDRTPTLEELAAVAAFSPCHFHRIYRAMAGEAPAETLARARLSRAAVELLRSGAPVERGEWLPGSGEEPTDRPCLEEYVNDPRATPPPELLTDIMLPLRERGRVPA